MLASVAFDAAIVNEMFYVVLVMLAIVSSMLAVTCLERSARSGGTQR